MHRGGILAATAALLAAGSGFAAPAVRLDFATALQMTLASSPVLQGSRAQLRAARGAAQAAEGARWPRLSASLTAARSDDPLAVFGYKLSQRQATFADFGAAQYTGPSSLDIAPQALDQPGAYDNFDTRLQIEWPIYAGGRTGAAVAAARAAVKAAQSGDLAARQAVVLDVLRAYEGVRAATAELAVARRAEDAAAAYLSTARKRYAEGTAIKSDVLTAQVNLEQSRLARRTAGDALESARDYLRTLTGVPASSEIAIGAPAEPEMPAAPLASLQTSAAAANPTLAALRSRAASSRAAVAGEEAAYRPSFSMVVRRDWNDRTLGISAPSYTVAGVLSWDLFDFGARRGAVERATGELDAAEAQVSGYAQRLRLEVDRRWRAAREAEDRVGVSATSVAQAREAQRILALRFDQGLATISELLDGQARLDRAEGSLVDARYALRISRAELLAALGELDPAHIRTAGAAAPGTRTPAAGAER